MDSKKNNIRTVNLSKKNLKSFNKTHLVSIKDDMKEITELNLEDNHIETTDNMQQLTSLKHLNLSNNLLAKLANLPRTLESLQVASNHLSEIFTLKSSILVSAFDQMVCLTKLNLSKNDISKLHPQIFATCYSLRIIDLSYNKISEQLDCFSNLKNLKELNLSYNKIVDVEMLNQLKGCTVSKLNLIGNKVVIQQANQCEKLLKNMLLYIEHLQVSQERSKTPQPKMNSKVEGSKENNSAISNKNRCLQSPIPDKHKNKSINHNVSHSHSSNRNLNNQFDLELKAFDQSTNMNMCSLSNQTNNTSSKSVSLFQSIPLFDQLRHEQQVETSQQKAQENAQKPYQSNTHKSCDLKLQRMLIKQKFDEILIQQQVGMIENLTGNRISDSTNQRSFAEDFLYDPTLQKEMNLIYLNSKVDVLLLAFSKQCNTSPARIDSILQELINTQTFLSSTQKEEISNKLLNSLINK